METIKDIDEKPTSIAPELRKMEVNEELCYPIKRLLSVRGAVERVSKQLKRKYSTSTNKDTICVTRKK